MRICLLVGVFLVAACSGGEKQIAESSTDIVGLAHSSRARFEIIYKAAGAPLVDTKVITSEALAGEGEQRQIIAAVNTIITALPDVADVRSEWISILRWALALGAAIAFIVAMFQTGLGTGIGAVLRRVFGWAAGVISRLRA